MFVNFEDDMLIRGDHLDQYLRVSRDIDELRRNAPFRLIENAQIALSVADALDNFQGPMSKLQLSRVIPGFIRVERVVNATSFAKRARPGPLLPVQPPVHVDPRRCCERPGESLPQSNELFLWETHIKALGIRQMPSNNNSNGRNSLDWVLLQRGGSTYNMESEALIGDYWSGRDGNYSTSRPDSMESIYANNQGGWMATREQIWNWHTRICLGGFLPPYQGSIYPLDGMNNVVEYWSGGGNLYGRKACHLQRIIPIDPYSFSGHLLYHTSNNKQKQLKFVKGLFSQVDVLLGQLHTVKKRAEQSARSRGD